MSSDINSSGNSLGQGGPSQDSRLGQTMDQRAFDWVGVTSPKVPLEIRKSIEDISSLVNQVASLCVNVMIYGKRGTEKKSIAQTIHSRSSRCGKPFLTINCRGLGEHLLEVELFGHEQGIFEDARDLRRGLLEMSNGGTLFLDEIGDMPFTIQHKFARVLESRTFHRMGGTRDIPVDVRIIAGTDRDLQRGTEEGTFHEDLYYCLNLAIISLPDLKDRPEEIPLLAKNFLQTFAQELNLTVRDISPEAMRVLLGYPWPGNVRELENVIKRAAIVTTDDEIRAESLPLNVRSAPPPPTASWLEVPPSGLGLRRSGR